MVLRAGDEDEAALVVRGLLDVLDDGNLVDCASPCRFAIRHRRLPCRRRRKLARQRPGLVFDAGRGRPPGPVFRRVMDAWVVAFVGRGWIRCCCVVADAGPHGCLSIRVGVRVAKSPVRGPICSTARRAALVVVSHALVVFWP